MRIKISNRDAPNVPGAIGNYSAGVATRDVSLVKIPLTAPKSVNYGIKGQTKQLLRQLNEMLEIQRTSLANLVKTNVQLLSLTYFKIFDQIYGEYLKPHVGDIYPARLTYGAPIPEEGVLVKMGCVAEGPEKRPGFRSIYTAGQLPINPITKEMVGGKIEDQTRQAFDNVIAIIEAAKFFPKHVNYLRILYIHEKDKGPIDDVRKEYFGELGTFQKVSEIAMGSPIEVDAIASVGNGI